MAHTCPDWWLTPHRTGGSAASEYSFDEKEFISVIQNNLEGVYAKALRYGALENGYCFEVDFEPVLASAGISYQPILGCFSSIEHEYDKVKMIGIPGGEMELVDYK